VGQHTSIGLYKVTPKGQKSAQVQKTCAILMTVMRYNAYTLFSRRSRWRRSVW